MRGGARVAANGRGGAAKAWAGHAVARVCVAGAEALADGAGVAAGARPSA
jgi:hypothetical protein